MDILMEQRADGGVGGERRGGMERKEGKL